MWARHVHQIKLAQQLIRMMSKGQGAQGGHDEDNEDDCSDISQGREPARVLLCAGDLLLPA